MEKIRVGVKMNENFSFIGTLDTVNKVPSAPHIKAVYVDLCNGRFAVASLKELIFINPKTNYKNV